jgi:hypothetical protein
LPGGVSEGDQCLSVDLVCRSGPSYTSRHGSRETTPRSSSATSSRTKSRLPQVMPLTGPVYADGSPKPPRRAAVTRSGILDHGHACRRDLNRPRELAGSACAKAEGRCHGAVDNHVEGTCRPVALSSAAALRLAVTGPRGVPAALPVHQGRGAREDRTPSAEHISEDVVLTRQAVTVTPGAVLEVQCPWVGRSRVREGTPRPRPRVAGRPRSGGSPRPRRTAAGPSTCARGSANIVDNGFMQRRAAGPCRQRRRPCRR